tara:strand:- start:295 stop:522 length:228 start_codon:yes stop_codon:yes gene_type:complete
MQFLLYIANNNINIYNHMKNTELYEAIMAHEEEEAEKLRETKQEAHAYHSIEGQLIKTALSTAAIKSILEGNRDG